MSQAIDKATAAKYGDLVNAVYDMFNDQPHSLTPTPSTRFAPAWKHIAWIDMKDFILGFTDPRFYGVVLQSTDPNITGFDYAIAIRGTEGPLEWIDDALAIPVPFTPVPDSGRVAYGFNKIYSTLHVTHADPVAQLRIAANAEPQSFAQQINALVAAQPSPHMRAEADTGEPSGRFLVVAHSLGAALATLYVMENDSLGTVQVDTICTFASPRVGWAAFVERFNALQQTKGLTSWCVTNVNDLVTRVPFIWLGYRDVDDGYEFSGAQLAINNPICMHHMKTYQRWLDPQNYSVPDGCELPAVAEEHLQSMAVMCPPIPYAVIAATAEQPDSVIRFTIDVQIPRSSLP